MSDSSSDSGNEMGENAEMEKVSDAMKINHLASDLTESCIYFLRHKVYKMLEAFDSDDPKAQEAAQKRVDNYLKERQMKHDEEMLNKKVWEITLKS